jgi:hypothetical protein
VIENDHDFQPKVKIKIKIKAMIHIPIDIDNISKLFGGKTPIRQNGKRKRARE